MAKNETSKSSNGKGNVNPLGSKTPSKEELEKVAGELGVGMDATAKKPAKLSGKTSKKSDEKKGPGVIESILEFVTKAGEKGITKTAILKKLELRFPDRASEGMSKTINVQLPKRMSRERKIKIVKLEGGKFQLKAGKAKAA
jgi:hypothetical protein